MANRTGSSISPSKLAELKKKAKNKKPSKPSEVSSMSMEDIKNRGSLSTATSRIQKDINAAKERAKKAAAKKKNATKSVGVKANITGSSISPSKLAELKKKAKENSKKPRQQSVPSMIAEMRSKSGNKTATARVNSGSDKKSITKQSVPSMIAEMRNPGLIKAAKAKANDKAKTKAKTTSKTKSGVTKVSADINYNVGESKGGVSFNKAFAYFRKKGAKTFTWNGKKYTTEMAKSGKKSKPKGMAV